MNLVKFPLSKVKEKAKKVTLSVIYIQLWEQAQLDNSRLRDDLARTRDELSAAKKKLETMVQVNTSF